MTEEEAKTKWCPYARVYSQNYITGEGSCSGGWNRHPEDRGDIPRCIGSACMAWRAETRQAVKSTGRFVEAGEATLHGSTEARPTGEGFCGLAGKP